MKRKYFLISILIFIVFNGYSQSLDVLSSLPEMRDFKEISKVKERNSKDINASNWSVGAEMMDRDFTIYNNWKEYLGKLGVKKARIQSGWARCEKIKGQYNWKWLDEIIYDMDKQGVKPWVNLSYGNPIYAGGGGTTLNAAVPKSEEALNAWKAYVTAIIRRYRNVVNEWEVWNEPNYHVDVDDYARLLITTAEIIRKEQADATVIAFAIGSGVDYKYVDKVLAIVQKEGKIHLIDQITHHRHRPVPEDRKNEEELEKVVRKYSDKIVIRQGEAGCPSGYNKSFALNKIAWTELTQCKLILRRMLTDLGYYKESSIFTIMDAKYPHEWNLKGLIKANQKDSTVAYLKPAYFAVQHLTSIFDDQLAKIENYPVQIESSEVDDISIYAYQHKKSKKQIITIWRGGKRPVDDNQISLCNLKISDAKIKTPVFVDMISGKIYEIPKSYYKKEAGQVLFNKIPVPDFPVLIADKAILK